MKTYRTNAGDSVSGNTARDVIKALRATSHDPEPSLEEFMRAMATRVQRQTGHRVPTNSQARFLAGLVGAGLLTEGEQCTQEPALPSAELPSTAPPKPR